MSVSDKKKQKLYKMVAKNIARAGILPFNPKSKILTKILKHYIDDLDELLFLKNFRGRSLNVDELSRKLKKPKEEVLEISDRLAKKGILFNQPNSKGQIVLRLLPVVVIGVFEYTFMRPPPKDPQEREELKQLAQTYEKLMKELASDMQAGYENMIPMFENQPAVDRTVPIYETKEGETIQINQSVEAEEAILPAQTVEDIIEKFDDIAVGRCFCRAYQEMLGHECEINAPIETCFTFGKSARHVIQQGFARRIDKNEALKILKQAEGAGLVHKAFHDGSDITRDENSICNCCPDCCDTFNLWKMGATPIVNSTNFLSKIDEESCIACGTCIDRCPMEAIDLNGMGKAKVNSELCIGCGVCAHFCPENAIILQEGMRKVYIPPPKLESN